jgi:hypothetical protein
VLKWATTSIEEGIRATVNMGACEAVGGARGHGRLGAAAVKGIARVGLGPDSLGPVQHGARPHSEGVGPFNPFPKFQSFSNIQTLSNL